MPTIKVKRVYEIARNHGTSSKSVLHVLNLLGREAKSPSTKVETTFLTDSPIFANVFATHVLAKEFGVDLSYRVKFTRPANPFQTSSPLPTVRFNTSMGTFDLVDE